MSIKILGSNFPHGGASANYLRNLALALSLSNKVEVLMTSGYFYGKNLNKENSGIYKGVAYRYLCFKQHPRNYFGKLIDNICSLLVLFTYLSRNKRKVDIIMSYNVTFLKTLRDVLACKLFSKKLIMILPEFYEKPNSKRGKINWYLFYIAIKYLTKHADGFIVFSKYLENYIVNDRNIRKPICITPNAIDPEDSYRDNIAPYKNNCTTIGYVGTPSRKDGINDLLSAFAVVHRENPKTHLLIIGGSTNGTSTLLEQAKQVAKNLNIEEYVTFTGLVNASVVPDLLHSCQILILARPSGVFAEAGFPTKLGEYFSCRKPVVVTAVGDIATYFKDGEHVVLVEPDNPQSVANGILRLIDNAELQDKLVNNAYQWMDEILNYRNMNGRMEEFIIKVTNENSNHSKQ